MDIDSLTKGITLLSSALGAVKQAIDLLPEGPKKTEARVALQQAERKLKMAEAETAKELGYELCRKHMPPEVMLSADDEEWECPKCGNKKGPSIQVAVTSKPLFSRSPQRMSNE